MASTSTLFVDFGVVLLAAGAVALLFYYLKQPVVLGYLLAGFLVGPFSPLGHSFVSDVETMTFLAELGVVFLLFALGLEFNLRKLKKVGPTAIIAGTVQSGIMIALGYGIGLGFGWTPLQSIFLGAIMAISSTAIIVKVLAELGQKDEDWAQLAFGILIIEDILAVLILTALSSAGATGNFAPDQLASLVWKLGVFLGAVLLLGLLAAPRIVDKLNFLKVEEIIVIVAASIGVGMAILAGSLGFSAGLGAFVAGALLAENPKVDKIVHKIEPVRDIFTAVFFVTVGAALEPAALVTHWRAILVVTAAVVVGKIFAVTFATFITGASPTKSLRVGVALAQIGEFSFIIAALAVTLGTAPPGLYAIAIAATALSAFSSPYLIRASPALVRVLSRSLPSGLHAYFSTYGAWLGRVGKSDKRDTEWRAIRVNLLTAALNVSVLVAIFASGAVLVDDMEAWLAHRLPVEGLAFSAGWLAISILAAPFAFMCAIEARQIIHSLARLAVPEKLRAAGKVTQTETLIRRTFAFAAMVGAAILCVVAGSFLVPNILPVLGVAAVGVGGVTLVLGRSLRRFHAEVERAVEKLAGDENLPREECVRVLEEGHAWGTATREVSLPELSGGAGRSLARLRLRDLTGATVVSLHRGAQPAMLNPAGDTRLEAGDRLLLVGEPEGLTRAEEILLGRELGVEGGASEHALAHDSPFVGRRVAELPLHGAELLLVRQAGQEQAPSPALTLAAGDVLILSGTHEEVREAIAALSSRRLVVQARAPEPRRFTPRASRPDECQHCGSVRASHEPLGACPAPRAA
ncbi:MAG TPA: cation:proton antiporter [Candidatus Thermoplasmatota archaeon]|nr:cation:proton antiporter [Candidatus Thermoplasmatota archaeon]